MTRWFLHSSIALALAMSAVLSPPRPVKAQDGAMLQREDDDEERLRRWMAVRASRSPDMGWLGGVAIGVGALALGAGIAIPITTEQREATPGAAAMIALGGWSLGLGIFTLLNPNLEREDYLRIPDRRLTEREIGRLEGLLRHEAETAGAGRQFQMWAGLGLLVGGLGAIPLVALQPPPDEQLALSWTIAGGSALLGLVLFVVSLFPSGAEADWQDYRRNLMPRETPRVSVIPTGNGFAVVF